MREPSILLVLVFLLSCDRPVQKNEHYKRETSREELAKTENEGVIRTNNINVLISALSDTTTDIEAEHIGFTGEKSATYSDFKHLSEIAADTTLLRLTYSANPKLRVYGMWALIKKNKELALKQLNRFRKDKELVNYHAVDVVMPMPVSSLVISRFDSAEVDR